MGKQGKKQDSQNAIIRKLIKQKHPDAWLIESASIGTKLITGEYGAFTEEKLITYQLSREKKLFKVGELTWPEKRNGEVDHFAIKSIFYIAGLEFVTGNHGKEVQKFLEGEKKDTFIKLRRPFFRKIVGFRSKKWWKQITAGMGYLLIFSFMIGSCADDDVDKTTPKKATVATTTTVKDDDGAKKEQEQQKAQEEANRKAQEEADRKAKEEADRKAQEEAAQKAEAEKKAQQEALAKAEAEKKAQQEAQQQQTTSVYYKNCTAVKNAGAAPIHKGEPGYAKHLDKDGDGIACDK